MITLRPVEEADIDVLYEQQADPLWAAMAVFPSRDREAHLAHWRRVLANPETISRAVLVDGVLTGSIGSWVDEEGRRLVGYGYGRAYWGRGTATEALRLFVDELTERPLYAFVALSNGRSARVLEKAGFALADEQPPPAADDVEELLYVLL